MGENRSISNIYIQCLPDDTTEDELKALFEQRGVVQRVRIRQNDKGAYAFVNFTCPEDAKEAMEAMQGFELRSKRIQIQIQRTRNTNAAAHPQAVQVGGVRMTGDSNNSTLLDSNAVVAAGRWPVPLLSMGGLQQERRGRPFESMDVAEGSVQLHIMNFPAKIAEDVMRERIHALVPTLDFRKFVRPKTEGGADDHRAGYAFATLRSQRDADIVISALDGYDAWVVRYSNYHIRAVIERSGLPCKGKNGVVLVRELTCYGLQEHLPLSLEIKNDLHKVFSEFGNVETIEATDRGIVYTLFRDLNGATRTVAHAKTTAEQIYFRPNMSVTVMYSDPLQRPYAIADPSVRAYMVNHSAGIHQPLRPPNDSKRLRLESSPDASDVYETSNNNNTMYVVVPPPSLVATPTNPNRRAGMIRFPRPPGLPSMLGMQQQQPPPPSSTTTNNIINATTTGGGQLPPHQKESILLQPLLHTFRPHLMQHQQQQQQQAISTTSVVGESTSAATEDLSETKSLPTRRKIIWEGQLSRNGKKCLSVFAEFNNSGENESLKDVTHLNVSHRTTWEDVSKAPCCGTFFIQPVDPVKDAATFNSYAQYFEDKDRSGVAKLADGSSAFLLHSGAPIYHLFCSSPPENLHLLVVLVPPKAVPPTPAVEELPVGKKEDVEKGRNALLYLLQNPELLSALKKDDD